MAFQSSRLFFNNEDEKTITWPTAYTAWGDIPGGPELPTGDPIVGIGLESTANQTKVKASAPFTGYVTVLRHERG